MRKQNRPIRFGTLALLVFGAQAKSGAETELLKQFGTPGFDSGTAIARHSTGVYVTGYQNPLAAQNPFGQTGFLRKYDFSGNEVWATSSTTSEIKAPYLFPSPSMTAECMSLVHRTTRVQKYTH